MSVEDKQKPITSDDLQQFAQQIAAQLRDWKCESDQQMRVMQGDIAKLQQVPQAAPVVQQNLGGGNGAGGNGAPNAPAPQNVGGGNGAGGNGAPNAPAPQNVGGGNGAGGNGAPAQQYAGGGNGAPPQQNVGGGGGAGGNGAPPQSGGGGNALPNGVAAQPGNAGAGGLPPEQTEQFARMLAAMYEELRRRGRVPVTPTPTPTASRRPLFDYIAGSVMFASSYLALGARSRRGIAQVLPFVPAGVAALEWARRENRDSGLATLASGAVGVGALFLGPR